MQVRAYDNNKVRAVVEWIGRVENPQNTFLDYYKVFRFDVWNYMEGSQLAHDPSTPTFFSNEEEAVNAYEAFLLKWTEAERDDEGVLLEVGNALVPPPPPNPDAPASAPADDDVSGVGAW